MPQTNEPGETPAGTGVRSVTAAAPPGGGGARPALVREPDRRRQHKWVPIATGWFCLLIGLADIIRVALPEVHDLMAERLHRLTPFMPGVLTNVTNTADVIIGLMLLMLSNGLRRRKRRAWQATTLLLAFSVVIH